MGKILEGPQAGRVYYACGQGRGRGQGQAVSALGGKPACMHFQWASEAAHMRGPPRVKYTPFLPPSLPQEEMSEAHYSKYIGLINEGTGACVNHLVESALVRSPVAKGMHTLRGQSAVATTGAYDRGLVGVDYDAENDSDDSDDSTNLRHGLGGTAVAEDTDEDLAEGEEENGEGDSDEQTLHTDAAGVPAGIPHGVPYLNQGL